MGETLPSPAALAQASTFSILERIDVGETHFQRIRQARRVRLSVSSNGSTWVKLREQGPRKRALFLSVSSNGSTWVKPPEAGVVVREARLSVSSNGSTWVKLLEVPRQFWLSATFSILERIDVGETNGNTNIAPCAFDLSVSSNGSTWVKLWMW